MICVQKWLRNASDRDITSHTFAFFIGQWTTWAIAQAMAGRYWAALFNVEMLILTVFYYRWKLKCIASK